MSNQGYYSQGPQYPQQSYGGGGYPQQGYGGHPQQGGGYYNQGYNQGPPVWHQVQSTILSEICALTIVQMQYQQGPPQQVVVKEKRGVSLLSAAAVSLKRVVNAVPNVANALRAAVSLIDLCKVQAQRNYLRPSKSRSEQRTLYDQ
ncbi:hypothetical protein MMC10_008994 [Thelotrema lepadinum]|nr:hypothetical protein [Thelotrema lepadinum]